MQSTGGGNDWASHCTMSPPATCPSGRSPISEGMVVEIVGKVLLFGNRDFCLKTASNKSPFGEEVAEGRGFLVGNPVGL
jgi:hypothetical protein